MKFVYPVTLEPEVTWGWYLGLCTLIGPILVYLTEKGSVKCLIKLCSFFNNILLRTVSLKQSEKSKINNF